MIIAPMRRGSHITTKGASVDKYRGRRRHGAISARVARPSDGVEWFEGGFDRRDGAKGEWVWNLRSA